MPAVYFVHLINTLRNPESVKKRTITDCHLFVFVILLVSAVVVVLLAYVFVEVGLPGYDLSKIPNADHPSEFVGVRAMISNTNTVTQQL